MHCETIPRSSVRINARDRGGVWVSSILHEYIVMYSVIQFYYCNYKILSEQSNLQW